MKLHLLIPVLAAAAMATAQTAPQPHHVTFAAMSESTRTMVLGVIDADAKAWDPEKHILRTAQVMAGVHVPGNPLEDWHYWSKCCYNVRGTAEYALNLLMRDAPGDRERAGQAIESVLKVQYNTPGVRWYGTFKRTPEEPEPGPNAAMWRDYDPNWREFIGTTFEVILIEFPDRLSPELSSRMYASIDRAIEGEMAEKRLVPAYTNPSLMYGSLWDFAAAHNQRADWQMKSGDWIEGVYSLYSKYGAFSEFNSPTYDAVDLYGLALWRDYGSTQRIRAMGAEIEAALWREIADMYQPDLHNMAGPYDRSYGMDMESYVSGVGPLMATAMDLKTAPVPSADKPHGSGTQFCISPEMAILGTHIPPDALARMKTFAGEHLVRRQITDQRIATAWVGRHVIFGAESTEMTKDVRVASGHGLQYIQPSQFHPVTIQWRTPTGEIGWVRVAESPMIDAVADEHGITIDTHGTLRIRIHAAGMAAAQISQTLWDLPGMQVGVTADAQTVFTLEKTDPTTLDPTQNGDDGGYDIVYAGITKMRLEIKPQAEK